MHPLLGNDTKMTDDALNWKADMLLVNLQLPLSGFLTLLYINDLLP